MKISRSYFLLVLVAGLAVSCAKKEESSALPPDAGAVIARIDDTPLHAGRLLTAFQETFTFEEMLSSQKLAQSQKSSPVPGSATDPVSDKLTQLAKETVFFDFVAEKAKGLGLDQTDSFKKYESDVLKVELYQRILIEDVLKKVVITEDDVRRYYQDNRDDFKSEHTDLYRLRAIYVKMDDKPEAEAWKKINEAYAKLEKTPFPEVALQYSEAQFEKRGQEGEYAVTSFRDPVIIEKLDAVGNMSYTEPFQSGNSLYIFQKIEKVPPVYVELSKARYAIVQQLMHDRQQREISLLHHRLEQKYKPTILPELVIGNNPDQYDVLVLIVGDVFELTLGEFLENCKREQKVTLQNKLEYLEFLAQKSLFVAEARSRGWNEATVEPFLRFHRNKKLMEDYVLEQIKDQPLPENVMKEAYQNNIDSPRFKFPEVYDLYYMYFAADIDPTLTHTEEIKRMQVAEQQAQEALADLRNGQPFSDVLKLRVKDKAVLQSNGYIGRVTLNEIEPVIAENISTLAPESGEITQPVQVYNHSQKIYGYHIYHINDKTPSRTMTFDEAKKEMQVWHRNKLFDDKRTELWDQCFTEHEFTVNQEVVDQVKNYILQLAEQPERQVDVIRYAQPDAS